MAGKLWAPIGDKSKGEHQDGWSPEGCKRDEAEPAARAGFVRATAAVKRVQLRLLLSHSSRRPRENICFSKWGCWTSSIRAQGDLIRQEPACSCPSSCLGRELPACA